jgi:hypothetical protein
LDKNGQCFQYLTQKFPLLSTSKVKEGVFDGPQIGKLTKDSAFSRTMTDLELQAWESFKEVMIKFLGNVKYPQFEEIVRTMLEKLRALGCNMSLKLHFLHFRIGGPQ